MVLLQFKLNTVCCQGYHEHLGAWGDSVQSLVTMVMMMFYQASGRPSGNHGLFHRYRIEAVTMRAGGGTSSDYGHGFLATGKYVLLGSDSFKYCPGSPFLDS